MSLDQSIIDDAAEMVRVGAEMTTFDGVGEAVVTLIKLRAEIAALGPSRELSLALTKLDEARLWLTDHFTQRLLDPSV